MKQTQGLVRLSATDLSNHLACPHLTAANLAHARGERQPPPFHSPNAVTLQQLGLQHEKAYLAHLAASGLAITDLSHLKSESEALKVTRQAMATGAEVIAQAALESGPWFGRPDLLRKTQHPSNLGAWSYEPYDCKLSRHTKAASILQLAHYAALLHDILGHEPDSLYVVPPSPAFTPERYRYLDYAAYYRQLRTRLQSAIHRNPPTTPDPNAHCEVCRWWPDCHRDWRQSDHLAFTAGISRLQRKQLTEWNIPTMGALAGLPVPLQNKPSHGSHDGYTRIREQARLQVQSRVTNLPLHELLPLTPARGFHRLPEPSPGDIFFDLESAPFAGPHGREYLFGLTYFDDTGGEVYERCWALTAAAEKAAFQWFIAWVMARRQHFPGLHIYHFSPKEPSTLKALMGRYATCEDELDRLLRAGVLIDLHSITKQALRASVEQYSLKDLERFHGFTRTVPLPQASTALHQVEHALELLGETSLSPTLQATVEGYNADDCRSTRALRHWLEQLRAAETASGVAIERPTPQTEAPSEDLNARQQAIAQVVAALQDGVPADPSQRTQEQDAQWLLSNLLDWHRREQKVSYWEKFRLRDLSEEELEDERSAIAGLEFIEEIPSEGKRKKLPLHIYTFPAQETKLGEGDDLYAGDTKIGSIEAIDAVAGTVSVRKTGKAVTLHPHAAYSFKILSIEEQAASLLRLGQAVLRQGLHPGGAFQSACDLLLRRPPRLTSGPTLGSPLIQPGEDSTAAAQRLAPLLDRTVLAIQGPPGAGKTHTGGQMILELVRQGYRVGVTAQSHQVIRNLLNSVHEAATASARPTTALPTPTASLFAPSHAPAPNPALQGRDRAPFPQLQCLHKISDAPDPGLPAWLTQTKDNPEAIAAIQTKKVHILGATAWLWARAEAESLVDVLFVDEAGQMSLANVLAVAPAARSLVLLGDPQQLDQPLRGSHPDGADVSGLEHILHGAQTIPNHQGLFLAETWRMHPEICRFTSEVFYENRLESRPGLERQAIRGHARLGGTGLRFFPVTHYGNQNSAWEEVTAIEGIVGELLAGGVSWVDQTAVSRPLAQEDILVVAPYNAQVAALQRQLPGFRIGTVDKFQGQQAPIVIYSLTTSTPEDAPRGMEFLYSLNRLNVATSRAKALVIVVGSPRLLEPECKTPRQLHLANALCRYLELTNLPVVIPATAAG